MPEITVERWWGNVETGNARRLIVLPGLNYPISIAGLFVPVRALAENGWTVWSVSWDLTDVRDDDPALLRAVEHACDAASRESAGAGRTLVLGKSVGTLAAGWAAREGLPAIWLTPLLRRPAVRAAIAANPAPQLLIGGSEDGAWDEAAARASGQQVLSLGRVNHGLYSAAGWEAYLDVLHRIADRVLAFAAALPE